MCYSGGNLICQFHWLHVAIRPPSDSIMRVQHTMVHGFSYSSQCIFFCSDKRNAEYQFPLLLCTHAVVVDTQEMVTGYTDDGVVMLTCEVYGYLRFNNPSVRWSRETGGGRQLLQNHPPKYTVGYSSGSRLAQNPDGTTRQSIVANLTIHQLETADAGRYVCETCGEEEVATQVTVVPDSRPTGQTLGTEETSVTGGTSVTGMTDHEVMSGGSTG